MKLKVLRFITRSHAEILLWPWPGPSQESKIRDEIHGLTGARSGCLGHNRAVTGTGRARLGSDRAVCFITSLGHVWRFLHGFLAKISVFVKNSLFIYLLLFLNYMKNSIE